MAFDRADAAGRYREHASLDGLRSLCGVDIDSTARMPAGTVRCVRCGRAADAARRAPSPELPGPAVPVTALLEFLGEAFTEAGELECAQQLRGLVDPNERIVAQQLAHLQTVARTLTAQRLIALAVQVIKRRRTVRQLQTLRQTLLYGG